MLAKNVWKWLKFLCEYSHTLFTSSMFLCNHLLLGLPTIQKQEPVFLVGTSPLGSVGVISSHLEYPYLYPYTVRGT